MELEQINLCYGLEYLASTPDMRHLVVLALQVFNMAPSDPPHFSTPHILEFVSLFTRLISISKTAQQITLQRIFDPSYIDKLWPAIVAGFIGISFCIMASALMIVACDAFAPPLIPVAAMVIRAAPPAMLAAGPGAAAPGAAPIFLLMVEDGIFFLF